VKLLTTNGRKNIKERLEFSNGRIEEERLAGVVILFNTQEMRDRALKAFSDAITSCGGKKELY
jgi:hypothetical protein